MGRSLKKVITISILVGVSLLICLTSSLASTPGSSPFRFLKNYFNKFTTIGGYKTPTNGFVTGQSFATGSADGGFNTHHGGAFNSAGDALYISDTNNHRIVKLTASTGAFVGAIGSVNSTIGTCTTGAATGWCTGGTFGTGTTNGRYNMPKGITYDSTNNALYFVDSNNNRIVKVNATTGAFVGAIGRTTATTGTCPAAGTAAGWCTGGTFASGATDGQFNGPLDVKYDSTNDALYIADATNNRVVKVTATTGAFVGAIGLTSATTGTCPASGVAPGWCTGGTFASGVTDGMFFNTSTVAYDFTNNAIYVTSTGGASAYRVQKITATTGAFVGAIGRTSSSTGTCPASGMTTGWCTGGTFTFGGGDGSFSTVYGIAYDATNNALYFSNFSQVLKFTATTGVFVGAIGLTTSSTGTCPASGATTAWCTGGTFAQGTADGNYNNLRNVVYDSTNNALYIIDDPRVIKVTATTGAFVGSTGNKLATLSGWTTLNSTTHQPSGASKDGQLFGSINFDIDTTNNFIFIAETVNNRISKFNLTTGAFVGAIGRTNSTTGTCPASGAAAGWCTGGNFISGSANGMLSAPNDVRYDAANDALYISDSSNFRVVKVTASTGAFVGAIGRTNSTTGTCPAAGIAPGWCTGGNFTSNSTDGGFSTLRGLAYDSTNNALYVADTGNSRLVKVTATTGAFVGNIGRTSASTGTCPASGAATGWCTGGSFLSGATDGTFNGPWGVFYDSPRNAIYVSEGGNGRVNKITATTGAFVGAIGFLNSTTGTCPASGAALSWCTGGNFMNNNGDGYFSSPQGIAVDPVNNALFVADMNNNRITKHSLSIGRYVGAIGKSPSNAGSCKIGAMTRWCYGVGLFSSTGDPTGFKNPSAVAFIPSSTGGTLYVLDAANERLHKITRSEK